MPAPASPLPSFEIYGLEKMGGPFKVELIKCQNGILTYGLEVPENKRQALRSQLSTGVTAARLDGQLIHLMGATKCCDTDLGLWLTSRYTTE